MARRPEPSENGHQKTDGRSEVYTPRLPTEVDAVTDKDLKVGDHVDYSAFHTETGYFTGPSFMRTWSETPVDWSWELLHALCCACAAFIQIAFVSGAPWECNLHLVVVITFLMSQRLFYAFWGGSPPKRRSSLIRPEDFGEDRTGISVMRDLARFILLAITFLDVGYCTAAVVQQDLVAQGEDKYSAFYGYVLATEFFLPPLLLSSVSVVLLRQSPDIMSTDLTEEALDARVNATDNLFPATLAQSLRRLLVYAAEAIWCLGVLPCRFARGPSSNDISITDTRVTLLDFLSVSASSGVPGGPSVAMCFMTAIFTLHVLLIVLCTDLNTKPLELQHLTHLLGKWKLITEQSAMIKAQAGQSTTMGKGGPHPQSTLNNIKIPEWSAKQCPYSEGCIIRDSGRYYEAQAPMSTIRPSKYGGLFQHVCTALYGNVALTRQLMFSLHILIAWIYFFVMVYGALFGRQASSVCTQEKSFLPEVLTSFIVPPRQRTEGTFTLHVGASNALVDEWEDRDPNRVLPPNACSSPRAAWIAPWLLLILGHAVQVHHMAAEWTPGSSSPASLRVTTRSPYSGTTDRACHQKGWMPPLYQQMGSSSSTVTTGEDKDPWLDGELAYDVEESGNSAMRWYPVWQRPGDTTPGMIRSVTTSSTYRFFRSARSPSSTGVGSAIRGATGIVASPSTDTANPSSPRSGSVPGPMRAAVG